MSNSEEGQTCRVCDSYLTYFSESDDDEEDKTNRTNAEERGICETCWLERVCHICGFVGKFADYYFCEICKKHTVGECGCMAEATPQYHGVTCRGCFMEGSYFCDRCGKDIVDFIKSTGASVCDGYTSNEGKCSKGIFCRECFSSF